MRGEERGGGDEGRMRGKGRRVRGGGEERRECE